MFFCSASVISRYPFAWIRTMDSRPSLSVHTRVLKMEKWDPDDQGIVYYPASVLARYPFAWLRTIHADGKPTPRDTAHKLYLQCGSNGVGGNSFSVSFATFPVVAVARRPSAREIVHLHTCCSWSTCRPFMASVL